MNLEVALSFIDSYLLALIIITLIYLLQNVMPLFRVTIYILAIELFSRLIFTSVLKLPYAEYLWYLTWATISLLLIYIIARETKRYPNLQKVTVPISFLILGVVTLEVGRYFERHYTEWSFFKSIYSVGSTAVNWLIIAYLFAPIALLLVKSIRSRMSAKH